MCAAGAKVSRVCGRSLHGGLLVEPASGPGSGDGGEDSDGEGGDGPGEWKVVDPAGAALWSRPRAGASEVGRLAASETVVGRAGTDGWAAVRVQRGGRGRVAWVRIADREGRAVLVRVGKSLIG